MDAVDRAIVNNLQGGFPVTEHPFAEVAATLGLSEADLISRLGNLLAQGTLTRFGPMYHAERLGGALTLAAMKIPPAEFDRVAEIVNGFPEVAHNYARDHAFNMWFVLATETPEEIGRVIAGIEHKTGHVVHNMPKIEEFFVGLRFEA
ncbi:MAG: Lrp/AsnC family transcriptional regulator [Pseudomonadota bacterium]